jgi:uncharacterized protein YbjT (DUF2867 family)
MCARVSRRRPPARSAAAEWARADLADGRGLREALEGCDVVVHLASRPYRGPRTRAVDVRGTATLAAAAADAGIAHLIYTSIVGVDAIPWRYFRVKLEAEGVVRAAPLRWSILRATQFYPLIDEALRAWARLPLMVGPGAVPGMPVDPLDVAARLVRADRGGTNGAVEEFTGPEVLRFAELADQWLSARGLPVRRLVRVRFEPRRIPTGDPQDVANAAPLGRPDRGRRRRRGASSTACFAPMTLSPLPVCSPRSAAWRRGGVAAWRRQHSTYRLTFPSPWSYPQPNG